MHARSGTSAKKKKKKKRSLVQHLSCLYPTCCPDRCYGVGRNVAIEMCHVIQRSPRFTCRRIRNIDAALFSQYKYIALQDNKLKVTLHTNTQKTTMAVECIPPPTIQQSSLIKSNLIQYHSHWLSVALHFKPLTKYNYSIL